MLLPKSASIYRNKTKSVVTTSDEKIKTVVKCKNIVHVSYWDRFLVHFLAIFMGFWVLTKRLCRWAWNPGAFYKQKLRDVPPPCLVDSSLGQHKYVKLKSGIKIHYVESGSKGQPLILLLHGFPDCWIGFRHQIPVLREHFRVVALDLKGFGDSDKPVWLGGYKIETIIEELEQFVGTLGVSRCTIIGHDLGALIGWFWSHCDQGVFIEKFIAISAAHPNVHWVGGVPQGSLFDRKWLAFVQLPFLPEAEALSDDLKIINNCHKHLEAQDILSGKKDEKGSGKEHLEAYKYTFSRKEDWLGPFNYYRNLPWKRMRESTPICTVSTLLVTGNKDPNIRMENIIKSTEYCDRFHVKIIEGAAHFPHQEQPDAFNKHLLKFLRVKKAGENNENQDPNVLSRSPSKGLMNRMMGAVSNTVKYGNSVIDSVQKRTGNSSVLLGRSLPSIGPQFISGGLNTSNVNS